MSTRFSHPQDHDFLRLREQLGQELDAHQAHWQQQRQQRFGEDFKAWRTRKALPSSAPAQPEQRYSSGNATPARV